MTRRAGGSGFRIRIPMALLLVALAISAAATAGPCEDSGQKTDLKAAQALRAKPAPVKPRGSRTWSFPSQAKVPPPAAEELPPFFGPRGALAPHVV